MTDTIGGTPVVKLSPVVPQGAADVFVSWSGSIPTVSYWDRMALATVEEAERRVAMGVSGALHDAGSNVRVVIFEPGSSAPISGAPSAGFRQRRRRATGVTVAVDAGLTYLDGDLFVPSG